MPTESPPGCVGIEMTDLAKPVAKIKSLVIQ